MSDDNNVENSINILKSVFSSKQLKSETNAFNEAETRFKEQLDLAKSKSDQHTRSNLTTIFVVCFFLMLIFGAIFVLVYNHYAVSWIVDLKDKNLPNDFIKPLQLESVLSLIVNSLGTSLGFIIGYYFKEAIRK